MGDRLKFFSTNFLEEAISVTASSENVLYPVENVLNYFRGKVWRSNGSFRIDSSNNLIVINDGADKIALISSGNYTGATLATQLQTQLNSISTNFTVSYNTSTFKFTISRTTPFSILWSDGANIIGETLGFSDIDDTGSSSYTGHEARINFPSEYIQIDLGIEDNPKAFFLIDANGVDIKIQQIADIELLGSVSNNWNGPEIVTLDYDNLLIGKINLSGLFTSGKRYFRLNIKDTHNPYGYIQCGKIYLGDCYELESSDIQREFPETFEDLSTIDKSLSGQMYADQNNFRSIYGNVDISLCNKNDVDFVMTLWKKNQTTTPFFIAFDSELKATNKLQEWTKYVRLTSPPQVTTVTCDLFNISLQVEEII